MSTPAAARLDAATRAFWRTVGRPVDLRGAHAWLDAPWVSASRVDDTWVEAYAQRLGGRVRRVADGGLLRDMADLDGPGFAASDLHPLVRDFYEHTGAWRMEVWTQWSPLFAPGGALVARWFGRRVGQLALPTRPLDVARGVDSDVRLLLDGSGEQVAAAWLRRLRASGATLYSGCYSVRPLPGSDRPSVHVAFPLEEGNVQVFLRPRADPDGSLVLSSPAGPFGADGAYVVVRHRGGAHAARAPIHEEFRVFVDDEGVLRTDHDLAFGSRRAARLHYRLERRPT
ncbi:hypothetical protein [Agilicoccus flavus]|uniref:hypothetical protein n=1 Tax=Agilicoccus flavus TaxID=2775968 RepID=UPI001CF6E1D9|nr:hypothetical protein [Agilicoccus flavus]